MTQYSADMPLGEVFQEIERRLNENPQPIAGITSIYQFDLSGETYQLHLNDGSAKTVEGEESKADCTLQMSEQDFKEMLLGNLNGTAAFMSGKLKVKGDMGKAMKLQSILSKYEV